jgi:hypothetical protein
LSIFQLPSFFGSFIQYNTPHKSPEFSKNLMAKTSLSLSFAIHTPEGLSAFTAPSMTIEKMPAIKVVRRKHMSNQPKNKLNPKRQAGTGSMKDGYNPARACSLSKSTFAAQLASTGHTSGSRAAMRESPPARQPIGKLP